MTCRECQNQLSAYIDDRLDAAVRERIDAHRTECSTCERSYRLMLNASRVLASEGPAEPSPGMAERAALAAFAADRKLPARSFFDRWIPIAWPAAAVAAAAAALLLVVSPADTSSSSRSVAGSDPVSAVLDDSGPDDLEGEILGVEYDDED